MTFYMQKRCIITNLWVLPTAKCLVLLSMEPDSPSSPELSDFQNAPRQAFQHHMHFQTQNATVDSNSTESSATCKDLLEFHRC